MDWNAAKYLRAGPGGCEYTRPRRVPNRLRGEQLRVRRDDKGGGVRGTLEQPGPGRGLLGQTRGGRPPQPAAGRVGEALIAEAGAEQEVEGVGRIERRVARRRGADVRLCKCAEGKDLAAETVRAVV